MEVCKVIAKQFPDDETKINAMKDSAEYIEAFEEKMSRLTSELSDMFVKSHELEEEIRKKLGAIGYEI